MTKKNHYPCLRLILGDQINANHSWFKKKDNHTLYIIAELHQELTYVKHHCQKICAFFAAMEAFANALTQAEHQVLYLTLDDTSRYKDLPDLIHTLCQQYQTERFEFQRPDEYRLQQQLIQLNLPSTVTIKEVDSEHFLLPFDDISHDFTANKHHKMEFFYRKMRQRFNLLMENNQPIGGRWNYDVENRHKLKKADLSSIPQPLTFNHSVSSILKRLQRHNIAYFGEETEDLIWPITRKESIKLLNYFCQYCLPLFGKFQDAMTCQHQHQWSLYHSRLSFAINIKMLHPLQVIQTAIDHYNKHKHCIALSQIEGFVRQILGWREYIRGIYWINMPNYASCNQLNAQNNLPHYFWTGQTQMNCMRAALQQSLQYSYAHHIQRLMITGNFCLLTGIEPNQVDNWYLGIYIDAIEWVELPNTRGMSQFADEGIVATKPYAASGNYIQKMSDYCQHCQYKVKEKTSEQACPFNSLYWHFMTQHRSKLEQNPRTNMIYRNWDKQDLDHQQAILKRASWCLDNINAL